MLALIFAALQQPYKDGYGDVYDNGG